MTFRRESSLQLPDRSRVGKCSSWSPAVSHWEMVVAAGSLGKSHTWYCLDCVLCHCVSLVAVLLFPPSDRQSFFLPPGSYIPERWLIMLEYKESNQGWKSQMQKSGFILKNYLPFVLVQHMYLHLRLILQRWIVSIKKEPKRRKKTPLDSEDGCSGCFSTNLKHKGDVRTSHETLLT